MNPLTNVKNIQKLSEQELKRNFKTSWHDQYKDSAWVFIGGLPYDLTEGDVICVFSQYGEVVNLNLVRDKATGKSKGFCFLCYEDQRSTVLAVDNFNGMKILGRTIRVDHVNDYKPPKESKKIDDVTRMLYETGCAPGSKILEVAAEKKEEKPDTKDGILEKVKKVKKKKAKKHKKSAKKKTSKKKRKRSKDVSSSESSTESSSESSSSEDEESDQGGSKAKEKKKDGMNQRDLKSRRGDSEERVRIKVEEEEEEKKKARREHRKSPNREFDHSNRGHSGSQKNGTKSGEPQSSRNTDGDLGVGKWSQDGDRRRPDRLDMDTMNRRLEKQREEDRRGKHSGTSKDDWRQGKEWDGKGIDRRSYRNEKDDRDQSSRRDEAWVRKDRLEKEDCGKWESASSRRKGERHDSGHEKMKREEKRLREERSRSPYEKENSRSKRSR